MGTIEGRETAVNLSRPCRQKKNRPVNFWQKSSVIRLFSVTLASGSKGIISSRVILTVKKRKSLSLSVSCSGWKSYSATSYELWAMSYELRVTSYELRATSYELQATSYELWVTSYELQATSYELRAIGYGLQAYSPWALQAILLVARS